MRKALIVIDAQEDFTYGSLGTAEAIEALKIIERAVEYATDNDMEIIYTRDTHKDEESYLQSLEGKTLPVPHCLSQTKGWQLCMEVLPRNFDNATVINKSTFGTLDWNLRGNLACNDAIWICGFCTDICVMANFQILKTLYRNTPICVIKDACAGTTPEKHQAALSVMTSCQAVIASLDKLIWP